MNNLYAKINEILRFANWYIKIYCQKLWKRELMYSMNRTLDNMGQSKPELIAKTKLS